MNTLIICQYFPPENRIGAVRPSRIAKYLDRYEEMQVSVLTVEPIDVDSPVLDDYYFGVGIKRVAIPRFVKRLNSLLKRNQHTNSSLHGEINNSYKKTSFKGAFKNYIRGRLFRMRECILNQAYYSKAKRLLKENNTKYDVVISTYNTEFGHKIGLWYKKRHPEIKWITDYRDALWGSYSTLKQKKHGIRFVKRVSKWCDEITVVSNSIVEIHKRDFSDKPVHIIPNGYDLEDSFSAINMKNGMALRIVYTGELYNGKRDLTPLFKAISELIEDGIIKSKDIEMVYAGKSYDCFKSQIDVFPEICYRNLGFVDRQEALSLQSSADILLLASWCEPNEKEILTGKFFEYLQMKKPIICIISGSASGCRLTRIIKDHSLGFSYEAVTNETDKKYLYEYLKKQIFAKKALGHVEFVGDDEYIKRFDYKTIAGDFYKIIQSF